MYSFYYVATGLNNVDIFFSFSSGDRRDSYISICSCSLRVVLNVANSVGTEL